MISSFKDSGIGALRALTLCVSLAGCSNVHGPPSDAHTLDLAEAPVDACNVGDAVVTIVWRLEAPSECLLLTFAGAARGVDGVEVRWDLSPSTMLTEARAFDGTCASWEYRDETTTADVTSGDLQLTGAPTRVSGTLAIVTSQESYEVIFANSPLLNVLNCRGS